MKPVTKILNDRDKVIFEKALKFYFFARQQDIQKLNSQLQARFSYSGQVAYSLIITYLREEKFKIEYMDFLNEEIKTLRDINHKHLKKLQIRPEEINEIEFPEKVKVQVYDEDEEANIILTYFSDKNTLQLRRL